MLVSSALSEDIRFLYNYFSITQWISVKSIWQTSGSLGLGVRPEPQSYEMLISYSTSKGFDLKKKNCMLFNFLVLNLYSQNLIKWLFVNRDCRRRKQCTNSPTNTGHERREVNEFVIINIYDISKFYGQWIWYLADCLVYWLYGKFVWGCGLEGLNIRGLVK